MSPVVVVLWCVVTGAGAWWFRPRTSRIVGPLPPGGADAPVGGPSFLDRVGRSVTAVVPALEPVPARHVSLILLAGVLSAPMAGPWSAALVLLALACARATGRRRETRRLDRDLTAVATIADLLGIALGSGLALGSAIVAVQQRLRPGDDAGLAGVVVELERGRSADEALDAWAGRSQPVGELAALLRGAGRSGAAIVDALARLGNDVRRRSRRRAEERARRLPVAMLLPLVTCVLPAFGLVTVVPMVAVGLGRLGSPG